MVKILKSVARVVVKHWKFIALTALKIIAQRPSSSYEERVQQTLRDIAISILDLQGE